MKATGSRAACIVSKSRGLIASALLVLIAGCGFHPAGSRPLPTALQKVYIDVVAPYRVSEPPLETSLRTRLLRQGAEVTKDASSAYATIKLSNLKEGRQVLSVGPDGKALEFLLVTTVDYEVHTATQVLVPPGSLRMTRDYSFNEGQILAKEAEEDRLREYIQDGLAELLLLKVETVLSRQETVVPQEPARVVPPQTPAQSQPQLQAEPAPEQPAP